MNEKIYLLKSNMKDFSIFIHDSDDDEENIFNRIVDNRWEPIKKISPIKVELDRSDTGKKNYNFDISSFLSPMFIFSKLALESLSDILVPRGQLLPITTHSKKKKFLGYYPTNPLPACFDNKKSIYREYPNGLMIKNPTLIYKNIIDEYLFSIEEDISRVFVTNKFKKRVEEAGLLGFDFSVEIPTS